MVRINAKISLDADKLQVSHLDTLFLDRGFTYLSKYIAEAVQLYNGMSSVDHYDYIFYRNMTGRFPRSQAYIVTVLCVYLAIKDLAHVLDVELAWDLSYKIWCKPSPSLWNSHPYLAAIRLASTGNLLIWNEALKYQRDNKCKKYLGYFELFKINQDIADVVSTREQFSVVAQSVIGSALLKKGFKHENNW